MVASAVVALLDILQMEQEWGTEKGKWTVQDTVLDIPESGEYVDPEYRIEYRDMVILIAAVQ